ETGGSARLRMACAEQLVVARFVDRLLGGERERLGRRRASGQCARNAQRGFFENFEQREVEAVHLGERPRVENYFWERVRLLCTRRVFARPLQRRHAANPTGDRIVDGHRAPSARGTRGRAGIRMRLATAIEIAHAVPSIARVPARAWPALANTETPSA